MLKKSFFIVCMLCAIVLNAKAQVTVSVTDISVQNENQIKIGYSIIGIKTGETVFTTLYVTEDGQKTWTKTTQTTGEIGSITYSTKMFYVIWKPLDEPNRIQLMGENIFFKVIATVRTPKPTIKNLPEMVKITGGEFTMGASDLSYTEHSVTLSDYYIGKYEVTNIQFAEFLNDYGESTTKAKSDYPGKTMIYASSGSYDWGLHQSGTKWTPVSGYENYPVINVTWYGAYEYCKWLSEKTGEKYSLPSEAQWEYAAGGGSSSRTKWAGTSTESSLGDYCWYSTNSGSKTHAVGTKTKNTLGLHDMSGNVWEWCMDWYGSYTSTSQTNPTGASSASNRVLRGGGWGNIADYCRVADRGYGTPAYYDSILGFRVVRSY